MVENPNITKGLDPYQFNPGQPFFGGGGPEKPDDGNRGEIPIVDPTAIGTGDGIGDGNAGNPSDPAERTAGRRTRSDKGKPRGPRTAAKEKAFYLGGFENLLVSAHLMLAAIAECPELELTEDEAEKITRALDDVRAYYNVVLTEGQQVWGNVVLTASAVYGPKALAIYARKAKPRAKPSVVTPIRPKASEAFAPTLNLEPEQPVA